VTPDVAEQRSVCERLSSSAGEYRFVSARFLAEILDVVTSINCAQAQSPSQR
jgi:hypothetical protein